MDSTTAKIEAVHQKLKSSKDLDNIAKTPLFLTFICLMHERIIDGTILELYLNIIWWLLDRYQKAFPDRNVPSLFGFQWEADNDKFQIIQDHYLEFPQLLSLGSMALQNIKRDTFQQTDLNKFLQNQICEQIGFLIKGEKRDESFRRIVEFYFPHRTIQEFLAAFSYLKIQTISNDDKDFMEREIFNKNISTLSKTVFITEYEKFLWRIVASDKLSISPEMRFKFFTSYSTLVLDLDIFCSSAKISFHQLITYIEKCSNITELFLYSLTSNFLLNEPIDLSGTNLPVLKKMDFNGCSFQENSQLSCENFLNLEVMLFWKCSFMKNSQLSGTNLPVFKKMDFNSCSFQKNSQLNCAKFLNLEEMYFEHCSFMENSLLSGTNLPVFKKWTSIIVHFKTIHSSIVQTS